MPTLCATLAFGGRAAALSDLLGRAGAHKPSDALLADFLVRTRACETTPAAVQRDQVKGKTLLPLPLSPPLPPSPPQRLPSTEPLQPAPLLPRWPKLLQTPRPPAPPPLPLPSVLGSLDETESRAALGPIGMEAYAQLLDTAGLRLGAL